MTGKELKIKLKNLDVSLSDLAEKLDLTPQNLQSRLKIEDIGIGFLSKIAKAINKSVYELMDETGELGGRKGSNWRLIDEKADIIRRKMAPKMAPKWPLNAENQNIMLNREVFLASNLKDLRKKYDLLQKDVANVLKINKNKYNSIELGKDIPNFPELFALAKLFNVTAEDLLFKDLTVYADFEEIPPLQKGKNAPENAPPDAPPDPETPGIMLNKDSPSYREEMGKVLTRLADAIDRLNSRLEGK